MGTSVPVHTSEASGVLRYRVGLETFNGVVRAAAPDTCSTGWHMLHLVAHVQRVTLAELLVPVAHMFNGWRVQSCSTGGVSGCSTCLSACSTGCLLLSMADVSWS
jgi:hypothetical protein